MGIDVFQFNVPHQWIAQQVGPVSVYCNRMGCHVLCLQHGIPVYSTLVKVPLLQHVQVGVRFGEAFGPTEKQWLLTCFWSCAKRFQSWPRPQFYTCLQILLFFCKQILTTHTFTSRLTMKIFWHLKLFISNQFIIKSFVYYVRHLWPELNRLRTLDVVWSVAIWTDDYW